MSRRPWGGLIGAISLTLSAVACASDSSGGSRDVKTADAYVAAIRWYIGTLDEVTPVSGTAETDADTDPVVIFVAPDSGKAISSQTQADVVKDLSEMSDAVTVRFADVRDDVLETEVENLPVKDDGVLLLVGQVDESAPPVDVDVAVYHNVLDTHSFVMRITRSGESFAVTQASEVGQG